MFWRRILRSSCLSLLPGRKSASVQPVRNTSSVAAFSAAMRLGSDQKRGNDAFKPRPQDYFAFTQDHEWEIASCKQASSTSGQPLNPKTVRLISWNIDMLIPFGNERMTAALQYLEKLVAETPPDTALILFLQEMTRSDLNLIRSSSWVQQRFNITDIDHSSWLSTYYGTVTLIDTRLSVSSVFRVPFLSKFGRDGLFVDVELSASKPSETGNESPKVLRFCNVHLESLVANPPIRPHQLSAAATYLHAPEAACALVAGDMNAIEPFDRTLHSENELQDAYLSLGGEEDSDVGYTWGYQIPVTLKEKFGCSRMDKILFCGDLKAKTFERIGAGVKVAEEKREEVCRAGEEEWVSDHYGVMGDFEIGGDWRLRTRGLDDAVAAPQKSL